MEVNKDFNFEEFETCPNGIWIKGGSIEKALIKLGKLTYPFRKSLNLKENL